MRISKPSLDSLITSRLSYSGMRAGFAIEREELLPYGKRFSNEKLGKRLAERKVTMAIMATLSIAGILYLWRDNLSGDWFKAQKYVWNVVPRVNGFYWQNGRKNRTLIYNLTTPLVKNNVDLCLFDATPETLDKTKPQKYLALGELKGGIDPAGADEHWKTARTAIDRIRKSFKRTKLNPHTFFIGAAIEKKRATELWDELEQGILSNAANLNNENQVVSISRWLCNL